MPSHTSRAHHPFFRFQQSHQVLNEFSLVFEGKEADGGVRIVIPCVITLFLIRMRIFEEEMTYNCFEVFVDFIFRDFGVIDK
jgi:hypothetical protein